MMSDLSNALRNMKFMQRTSESRKKSLKKPSTTTSQVVPIPLSTPIITTPDHPGCWRIVKNEIPLPSQPITVNPNYPSITYRNSVFSINDRVYTRLSFQNYNKRIEPLMVKYGLKEEEINKLEDGEIDPDDDDNENEKKILNEDNESIHVSTLVKTIRKKFNKKPFSRIQFDSKTRITKRKRRTRHGTSTN